MSVLLVTGGAGFIGSNFVHMALQQTPHQIVVLDALTYAGNLQNLAAVLDDPRLQFVQGDICDASLLNTLMATHDISQVVHFAAESHVDRSILGPKAFLTTNIEGTYTLLEACRAHWHKDFSDKRFVHVSTDEVYGSLGPDDPAFCETTPFQPSSPYSASKAASDHLVSAWHHTYGVPTMISNCSNNYGPWQFPEKLIPLIILNAVEGKPLPIYGDGMQVRDWLHVEDHCKALLAILERGKAGETYMIGGNNEQANLHIVQRLCAEVDRQLQRPEGTALGLIEHVKDRPGHDRRYAVNASKIKRELGWQPTHTMEQILPEVVAWYLAHLPWAAAIRSGEYRRFYEEQYGTAHQ